MSSPGERFAALPHAIPSSPTFPPTTATTAPAELAGRPGLERLEANLNGDVPPPPAWFTLGFMLVDVTVGRAVFELAPLAAHTSYGGHVHGGVLSALADSAMGCATLSALDADRWCATLALDVSYLRPVPAPGERVRAVGTVRQIGGSTAFTDASLTVGDAEVVRATAVFAVRGSRRLPGQPEYICPDRRSGQTVGLAGYRAAKDAK